MRKWVGGREGKGKEGLSSFRFFSFFHSVLKNCLLLHGELKICCDCVSFGQLGLRPQQPVNRRDVKTAPHGSPLPAIPPPPPPPQHTHTLSEISVPASTSSETTRCQASLTNPPTNQPTNRPTSQPILRLYLW